METTGGKVDFNKEFKLMRDFGYDRRNNIEIKIENAKYDLMAGLDFITDNNSTWLPEYDIIVEWLTDNKGRGLLAYGNVGRGKTIILGKVIPTIIHYYYHLS